MTHALALAFQKMGGIRECRAVMEADACVRCIRIHVSKRRISRASDRTSVMQEFTDILAASSHAFKPCPRHQSERIGEAREPGLDPRIAPDCARKAKQVIHLNRSCSVIRSPAHLHRKIDESGRSSQGRASRNFTRAAVSGRGLLRLRTSSPGLNSPCRICSKPRRCRGDYARA